MSTMDKIQELKASRSAVESGAKAARGRIASLLDPQSFVEIGAYVKSRSTDYNMQAQDTPADGVVTGYGTIEDRLVYVYSQDASVLGGAVGEMHAAKIAALYQKAVEMGAPVIGMIDSQGLLRHGCSGWLWTDLRISGKGFRRGSPDCSDYRNRGRRRGSHSRAVRLYVYD